MPFTIAHSAVALPVLRWLRAPYAASALVVGTMAPDFEYFLRLRPFASISHTLPGLLVFCLPAGAAVLAAFHIVIKRPAALLLPDTLRAKIAYDARRVAPKDAVLIALLILAGAATHLVWDGFTHADGWAVRKWSTLSSVVFTVAGTDVAVYKVLQHTSTAAGLSAVIVTIILWLRRQPAARPLDSSLAPAVRWAIVAAIVAVSAVTGGLCAALSVGSAGGVRALQIVVGRFVVASIAGFAVLLAAFSVAVQKTRA